VTPGLSDVAAAPATAPAAPSTATGWTRLARERLDAGDAKGALAAALEATRLGPESAGAFNALGRAKLSLGALADAKVAFSKATELNPLSSHAHNNLGLVLIYQGEFESAVHELELAVSLKPVEGYMWNNLGMALEHLGRFEDARDAYREGTAIGSKLAAANLARIAARKDLTLTEELDWMVDPVLPAKDSDLAGDAGVPEDSGAPIHD
jgi:Flp pilus assembly protein TadD